MLTQESEQTPLFNYSSLNSSILDTLATIDRFEWQAIEELRLMRDNRYFKDAGYTSFESYCEKELTRYGGYRRVRDLLAATKVVDTLPESLREKITKPSQTRPLLRLVKTPDKLQEVVAIAAKEKPFPTAADFAKAVQKVVPKCTSDTSKTNTHCKKNPKRNCVKRSRGNGLEKRAGLITTRLFMMLNKSTQKACPLLFSSPNASRFHHNRIPVTVK